MTNGSSDMRQKFEAWAREHFSRLYWPVLWSDSAEGYIDRDGHACDIVQSAWESWKVAYAEGMREGQQQMREKAAKMVEHFSEELTAEEWPRHGLCPAAGRFDSGWSEKVVPVVAKWIRALPLSTESTPAKSAEKGGAN